jgi:2'-5' RNA ligase
MHRLFVALRPPRSLRDALAATMGGVEGARWQSDDQLHMTLRFIGPVDGRTADDIAAVLGRVHAPPIPLVLGSAGKFDRRGRLEALWVGAGPESVLQALHRKIDHALVALGLPAEGRAYLPHITVARFGRASGGDPAPFLERAASLSGLNANVDAFGLYESHLGKDGAFYEQVVRYPLAARI